MAMFKVVAKEKLNQVVEQQLCQAVIVIHALKN